MSAAPVESLRNTCQFVQDWLAETARSPDPASQAPSAMNAISRQLKQAELALQEASPDVTQSDEWRQLVAEYVAALKELRARLGNFEITLRIRTAHMAQKRTRLDAIHSWADLAKHIG
jgi:hypothetical protein